MKKIYVVMEAGPTMEPEAVKAFDNPDDAVLFCREKNRNTCHTFYFDEIDLVEKDR